MNQGVIDDINFHPKFEEYRHKYHNKLREGCFTVRFSDKFLKCPFCSDSNDYDYNDLLRHANQIVTNSDRATFKEKAKHMGLIEYLERDFYAKIKCAYLASAKSTLKQSVNEDLLVWPWMAVVANIPLEFNKNDGGLKLKYGWIKQGHNPINVHLISNLQSHSRLAVVEFGKTWNGFFNVMTFIKAFEVSKHGRNDWYDKESCKDDKLYAWIASDEDYNSFGLVGDYLRRNSELKTVTDVKKEDESTILGLETMIDDMDKETEEMNWKISETDIQLEAAMKQKEAMTEILNRDKEAEEQLQNNTEQLEKIKTENKRTKWLLEEFEKGLKAREAINNTKKMKLDHENRKIKSAILEKKKANERALKVAEDQKRKAEKLNQKVIELKKKLAEKQQLELEIKRLKGVLEVTKLRSDKYLELNSKLRSIQNDLKQKNEEFEDLESYNQTLILVERGRNDELVDARKELISFIGEKFNPSSIGVKRMGELDKKPFIAAAKRHCSPKEASEFAIKLVSVWESHLRDHSWYPFKVITVNSKEVLDEEDSRITILKNEYDKDVFDAVVTALNELKEYNPNDRYPVAELWNSKEKRKATLKEGVEFLIRKWKSYKH